MLSLAAQKAPDLEVWSQLSPYSTGNKEDARQTLSGGPMESLLLHHEQFLSLKWLKSLFLARSVVSANSVRNSP